MLDRRPGTGLILLLLCSGASGRAAGRAAQDRDVAFEAVVGQPGGCPNFLPRGPGARSSMRHRRWIVIQNHSGQQFPIAVDDIQEFLIRWPTSFDALNGQSVVEAVGQTSGLERRARRPHRRLRGGRSIAGRSHVQQHAAQQHGRDHARPWVQSLHEPMGLRGAEHALWLGLSRPANMSGIPSRLHVVGNVLDASGPEQMVRIGLPGNNFATIVPDNPGGMTVTQVTRGSSETCPQRRLRLHVAPSDQSTRTPSLATGHLQADPDRPVQPEPLNEEDSTPRVHGGATFSKSKGPRDPAPCGRTTAAPMTDRIAKDRHAAARHPETHENDGSGPSDSGCFSGQSQRRNSPMVRLRCSDGLFEVRKDLPTPPPRQPEPAGFLTPGPPGLLFRDKIPICPSG